MWFDRRKCLLSTHTGTLFTIFEPNVTASGLRTMRQLTGLISRELRREDLPSATFGVLDQQELLLAKSADRSILGCMNYMASLCQHAIAGSGGLARTDRLDTRYPPYLFCTPAAARCWAGAGVQIRVL